MPGKLKPVNPFEHLLRSGAKVEDLLKNLIESYGSVDSHSFMDAVTTLKKAYDDLRNEKRGSSEGNESSICEMSVGSDPDEVFSTEFTELVKSYLARLLVQFRDVRSLTQKDLADLLNIAQPRVADMEQGRGNFTVDTLCKVLKVAAPELFRLDPVGLYNCLRYIDSTVWRKEDGDTYSKMRVTGVDLLNPEILFLSKVKTSERIIIEDGIPITSVSDYIDMGESAAVHIFDLKPMKKLNDSDPDSWYVVPR